MFREIFNRMIEGRQARANFEVAKILARTEYKNETPEYLEQRIEDGFFKKD